MSTNKRSTFVDQFNEQIKKKRIWGRDELSRMINDLAIKFGWARSGVELLDPKLVLVFAFRYALGRRTYASMAMCDELMHNWDELPEFLRKQIKDDIAHAIEHGIAGDDCDIASWNKILGLP